MPNLDPSTPITWRLRELMAEAGMFQTTELIGPLREAGIQLSREQVFRLVTKPPARLNMEVHLVCDGRGRPLSWVITGGNINDTTMMTTTLEQIRVPRPVGRPRQRPDNHVIGTRFRLSGDQMLFDDHRTRHCRRHREAERAVRPRR